MDYAGAVPCTDREYLRRRHIFPQYDPRTGVPLTPAAVGMLGRSFSGGHQATTPGHHPNNAVYDGVIVRTPWRWTGTANGKQLGEPAGHHTQLVKPAHITDGTSKTMMIAEKYVRNDRYEGGTNSDDRGWIDGWDADQMRSSCFLPINDGDPIGWDPAFDQPNSSYFGDIFGSPFQGLWNVLHFGSAHTAGINAAFADGSVRTISYGIDVVVFNSLGTRNGEALDETTLMDGVN
jgi:prepilin-type processing-associated H-X9-DG protein